LQDLVCAETIPGSPVHPSSGIQLNLTSLSANPAPEIDTTPDRLEMPFASVPESVAGPQPSLSVSPTPPIQPVSLSIIPQSVPATQAAAKDETTDEEEAITTTTTTGSSSASQSPRELCKVRILIEKI